jgi:hypothetical protein
MAQILSWLVVMDPIDMSLESILGGEVYAADFASKSLGLRWRYDLILNSLNRYKLRWLTIIIYLTLVMRLKVRILT